MRLALHWQVLIGLAIGVLIYNKLDQQLFTRLVILAMLLTGLSYIVGAAIDLAAAG